MGSIPSGEAALPFAEDELEQHPCHRAPPRKIVDELLRADRLFPCPYYGPWDAARYHNNDLSSDARGFSSAEAHESWIAEGVAELAGFDSWGDVVLQRVRNVAAATSFGQLSGDAYSYEAIETRLAKLVDYLSGLYEAAAESVKSREPNAYAMLLCHADFESSPNDTLRAYQPENTRRDLAALYRSAAKALLPLYNIARAVGDAGDAVMVTWGVKDPRRVCEKAGEGAGGAADDEHGFAAVFDVARAAVVFPTCDALVEGFRYLREVKKNEITFIKNRFKNPCFGYRDVLVNLRLKSHVCEIQLHVKEIFDAPNVLQPGQSYELWAWTRIVARRATAIGDSAAAEGKKEDAVGAGGDIGSATAADSPKCVTFAEGGPKVAIRDGGNAVRAPEETPPACMHDSASRHTKHTSNSGGSSWFRSFKGSSFKSGARSGMYTSMRRAVIGGRGRSTSDDGSHSNRSKSCNVS